MFNYNGTGIFLGLSAFFILIHMVMGEYHLKDLPLPYVLLVCLTIFIILSSLIFSFEHTDSGRVGRLVKFLAIFFSIHIVSRSKLDKLTIQICATVIGLSIIWQYSAFFLFAMPEGTFPNRHYLANFVLLTLPAAYYFSNSTNKTLKIFFLVLCILDIQLLVLSSSRTAIIGFVFSLLLLVFLFSKARIKLTGTLIISSVLLFIYLTDYANIYSRFYELFSNIQTEERTILWPLGWKMMSGNTFIEWLFGHGLGEISQTIPVTAHQLWPADTFPHLSIIELLYENGIVGTVLIVSGFFYIFFKLFNIIATSPELKSRILAKCLLFSLISFLFHTGITMHFYSKQTLYSLALIIGTAFALIFYIQDDEERVS